MKKYEIIDISGDVGLKIFGETISDLFSNAAEGFYSLITDVSAVEIKKNILVAANGDTQESLLIAFLNELIFFFDTDGFVGKEIAINKISERSVEAEVSGEAFEIGRHESGLLVKAATYHNISITKSGDMWTASVIFDI